MKYLILTISLLLFVACNDLKESAEKDSNSVIYKVEESSISNIPTCNIGDKPINEDLSCENSERSCTSLFNKYYCVSQSELNAIVECPAGLMLMMAVSLPGSLFCGPIPIESASFYKCNAKDYKETEGDEDFYNESCPVCNNFCNPASSCYNPIHPECI